MPVLATVTIVTLLRGGGDTGPFLDADKLRGLLTDATADIEARQWQRAIGIAWQLESELARYAVNVDRSIGKYADDLADPKTSADDLIARLQPIDQERRKVLESVIEYREQLLETLDDQSWSAVFD